MKPSDVQREVELTMSSLDRLRKAKAPVNFVEVLATKMIFAEDQVKWINRAKFALVGMIVMAILNGVLLLKNTIDQQGFMLDSIARHYHLIGDV